MRKKINGQWAIIYRDVRKIVRPPSFFLILIYCKKKSMDWNLNPNKVI